MATVVILHAAEDVPPARALAEKLRQAGMQPLIEQPPGEALHQAIRQAGAVLALWSPRSVAQGELVSEVSYARSVGGVIHARMQNAPTPHEFASDTSIDLTGWRGEDHFPAWKELAQAVAAKAGVALSAPAPRAASPFFQPGASTGATQTATRPTAAPVQRAPVATVRPIATEPPPMGPRPVPPAPPRAAQRPEVDDFEPASNGSGGKLALIAVVTFIVVAALGGGGFYAYSQMQGSQASASAWEHLDKTNPAALRAFLADKPGALRDQAQGVLTTLEQQRFQAARTADSIEAYQGFISDFPHSDHLLEARGRIAELQAAPATTSTAVDPLTGLPPVPVDPDLVPPGTATTPGATGAPLSPPNTGPQTGGPVPLTPPPSQDQPPTN